jgi:hypothetical protein
MIDGPNLDAVAEPARSGAGKWRKLRGRIAESGRALNPGPATLRGAALSVTAAMVVMAVAAGAAFRPGLGLLDVPSSPQASPSRPSRSMPRRSSRGMRGSR